MIDRTPGVEPWPATKDELIDFAARNGAALQLLEELFALPDGNTRYDSLESVLAASALGDLADDGSE